VVAVAAAGAGAAAFTVTASTGGLSAAQIEVTAMPREALFLAGKVFQRYRAGGGTRSEGPPDVFIGAHAAVAKPPLLTRDVRRYRTPMG
jgi:predicted nucleic acid-binding protein